MLGLKLKELSPIPTARGASYRILAHITRTLCEILQTARAPARYTRVRVVRFVLNSHGHNHWYNIKGKIYRVCVQSACMC